MATSLLITNIGELTTNDFGEGEGRRGYFGEGECGRGDGGVSGGGRGGGVTSGLAASSATAGRRSDAALIVEGDRIAWVGDAADAPEADERVDAAGRAVLPGWVDSHTHLVFGGDRTAEFEARMAGTTYAAGGINVTVEATRAASDAELARNINELVAEARRGGTTTIETKTGYGLSVRDELRSARIAAELVDAVTFLGAHVVPSGTDPEHYLALVTGEMLDAVAPYVSAVDVFCESGAFDAEAAERVLAAAADRGLATRVHGNQLGPGPGVQLAVRHGALSVDHVGFLSDADVTALADSWCEGGGGSCGGGGAEAPCLASNSGGAGSAVGGGCGGSCGGASCAVGASHDCCTRGTVATVLPACDLSTRMPLAPARRLLDAGAIVAIASNCNPGTSYTTSMAFCVATAVLQMGLTVTEAVRAATLGGAMALGIDSGGWIDPRGNTQPPVGRLVPGARADIQLLEAPSVTHLAYRPGVPLTRAVWRAGHRVV